MEPTRTVCKKDMCCGCMVCVDSCHKDAISIVDSLRAFNAVKNDNCIDCGLCEKVCPQNNPAEFVAPILCKQGWSPNDYLRKMAASGGFASAISNAFIKNGGFVCSCAFENGKFGFKIAKSTVDLKGFAGSKYVKSNPVGIYSQVKRKLMEDSKILFIGLPCQVAAVKKFIGAKWQEQLYTIDIICHGTPSLGVLDIFMKQNKIELSELKDVSFRHKARFKFDDGYKSIAPEGIVDSYTIAFHHSYSYTNNCYECQYSRKERVSDLTLGDAWGSSIQGDDVHKGISLALCQSQKGKDLLNMADIDMRDMDMDVAISHNDQLNAPSLRPEQWLAFFDDLAATCNLDKTVKWFLRKANIRQYVKYLCIKSGILKLGGIIYQINYK